MAPSYDDIPTSSGSNSPQSRPSRGLDDLAELEATYQDSTIQAGQEVEDFAAALDKFTVLKASPAEKRAQIFRLVDHYHSYSRQRVQSLRDRQPKNRSARGREWQLVRAGSASGDMDVDDGDDDARPPADPEQIRRAEEERQTWDLLRRVLPLRYRDSSSVVVPPPTDAPPQSRRQYWAEFALSESTAGERKLVLEWLQTSASYGPSIDEAVREHQQKAERGDLLAHGWLHTRHKIKLQKSVNAYQGVLDPEDPNLAESHLSSNTLVTQLDPDAVTRQGRRLEAQDESFERAIWLGCFEMLRRGRSMAEMREWCAERTESWRAATISSLPLSSVDEDDQEPFDPASAVLWRRMCLATAREGGTNDLERAVYGLLSGDVASVERVSKTWHDFLFAHYNALLRTQFDSFLVRHGGAEAASVAHTFSTLAGVHHHHGDPVTAGRRLVASLEKDERTRREALTPSRALQGAILANDLDRHLYQQGLVLAKQASRTRTSKLLPDYGLPGPDHADKFYSLGDHDGLRVLAHIAVAISALDRLSDSSSTDNDRFGALHIRHRVQENIVIAYVSFLRLANLEVMVPLYCSKLLGTRVYEILSRNLIQTVDQDARAQQLSIMKRLGLDMAEFAKTQPRILLEDVDETKTSCEAKGQVKFLQDGPAVLKYGRIVKTDFFGEDPDLVDAEDDELIRSVEWLMLVPGLLVETCAFATRIYKYFLKRMHLRAARALSNRVRAKDIILTKTSVRLTEADDDLSPGWFEDFAAAEMPYEVLEESHLDAEELVVQVRNLWELECLVRALDSMETLASLAEISREESTTSREMWQRAAREIRMAKACMQPVLKHWLLVVNQADGDFRELRRAYVPETVLTFVSSLHFAGTSLSRDNLLECMELAAVVADKQSDVAAEFVRSGRMRELVDAFASCSKALAIWTTEKKGSQTGSKKLREMGWSRELWSVK